METRERDHTFFFALRQASQPRPEGTPGMLGRYSEFEALV